MWAKGSCNYYDMIYALYYSLVVCYIGLNQFYVTIQLEKTVLFLLEQQGLLASRIARLGEQGCCSARPWNDEQKVWTARSL